MITFLDETGLSPLPAGTRISITPLGSTAVVASGAVSVNGNAVLSVTPGQTYLVTLTGTLVATATIEFQAPADGSTPMVVCPGIMSPSLSQLGYAARQRFLWVNGWVGPAERSPIAQAIAMGLGAAFATLDIQLQIIRSGARLETSRTTVADAWAQNYAGTWLLRYPGETTTNYVARLTTILSSTRMTLSAIAAVVNAYLTSTAGPTIPKVTAGLAEGTSGGEGTIGNENVLPTPVIPANAPTLAEGASGGEGTLGGEGTATVLTATPTVYVFDLQSDPTASAQVGITGAATLCIAFNYPGYVGTAYSGVPAYSQQLVNLLLVMRAGGFSVVFASNNPPLTY